MSDRELLACVHMLADREREATAAFIAHLAVMDERRLYLGEGCSSLFIYCMRVLRLSESGAYRRVEAARIARGFPVIPEMLSAGRINLTTIRLLAPELTLENHRELLEASTHKSRLEVERLIAGRRPRASGASTVRQLPSRAASLAFPAPNGPQAPDGTAGTASDAPEPAPTLVVRPPARPVVVPLSPKSYRIQFTASEETSGTLRRRRLPPRTIRAADGTQTPARAI